ncbi:GNAT family N-acetyltransferase [Bacillus cereus group sp. BfR-BA-01363]|uniref:GNAT family N-acetyltransferase n=1 Tax=Bacillus cereus group sp. BfR-BA-01363 TaxID=3094882 RepID=UPI0029C1A486|nr:GNAT family N-acetyltransferase [Bacillus cereus group sp. BfR-BA-01363]MDX5853715.1 GNAT family N-acetyltransferase [Bacillus cereus group sp. BfR-BA-01363]
MAYVFNHNFHSFTKGKLSLKPLNLDLEFDKEIFQFIQKRIMEDVSNENISVIYLNNKFIGFLQLKPFSSKSFQKDYGEMDCPFNLSSFLDGEKNTIVIENLFLANKHQGKGIGNVIVQFLQGVFANKTLLLYSLLEAESFWMRMGFTENNDDYVYSWNSSHVLKQIA